MAKAPTKLPSLGQETSNTSTPVVEVKSTVVDSGAAKDVPTTETVNAVPEKIEAPVVETKAANTVPEKVTTKAEAPVVETKVANTVPEKVEVPVAEVASPEPKVEAKPATKVAEAPVAETVTEKVEAQPAVDVGNLPKTEAEQHLKNSVQSYNKNGKSRESSLSRLPANPTEAHALYDAGLFDTISQARGAGYKEEVKVGSAITVEEKAVTVVVVD